MLDRQGAGLSQEWCHALEKSLVVLVGIGGVREDQIEGRTGDPVELFRQLASDRPPAIPRQFDGASLQYLEDPPIAFDQHDGFGAAGQPLEPDGATAGKQVQEPGPV